MDTHVKVLGILNIVSGATGLLGALFMFTVLGGAAGLVAFTESSPDAAIAVSVLSIVALALSGLIALLSLPAIIVGWGLLALRDWARLLGIALSIFHLLSFPFGTALGVYGLFVLLHRDTPALFQRTAVRAISV